MYTFLGLWSNAFSYELQRKGDIECYEKVMELHASYPNILYNFALIFQQKTKEYFNKNKVIIRKLIGEIKNAES